MRSDLPTGTVTFLFTDVEGSTKLLHELGDERYADALAEHRRIIREAFLAHGGVEVDTQGDAFFVAFPTAPGALRAAAETRERLADGPIRVRIGLHTGTPHVSAEGYVGGDVHRAARMAACGHGGQVLVSASTTALAGSNDLRDLGEHRLKDLSAPERIYQLGDGDFPPLKSLHQTNLPVPATPFLGREREVAEVAELVSREDVRLVTLTGPGGSGKTRLALQSVGAAADAFPGGVWWVPLAPLHDPALVIETAASALGASGELSEHIGDKRMLLLFDNFEHVVSAAPEVAALLEQCPHLTVCVTSREPLRLDGEWEYAVDPLRASEAVELFETRARAARRDFVANGEVREICARLDNLPLAIELAAARVKVLSPAALLERLERRLPVLAGGGRDAPERQRTLHATIEWSHELLSDDEQALFRRLSVFAGGASLDACEHVCEADLDVLASLVDKSLVRQTDDRFWMLETIREYAAERLAKAGEADEVRRAHAKFFVELAETAYPVLRMGDAGSTGGWFTRIDLERNNLRAAFETFDVSGADDELARLVAAVWPYLSESAQIAEGKRITERAYRAEASDVTVRASVVCAAAHFALSSGDVAVALERSKEAYALAGQTEDEWLVANAAWQLGWTLAESGDPAEGRPFITEAIRAFEQVGDIESALWTTRSLAAIHQDMGEFDTSRALHEENVGRARAMGNRQLEVVSLGAMAMVTVDQGRPHEALALLNQNTSIYRELDDTLGVAVNCVRVAYALAFIDAHAEAATLIGFAESRLEELGARPPWVAAYVEETRKRLRAAVAAHELEALYASGRQLPLDEALALALQATARGGQ